MRILMIDIGNSTVDVRILQNNRIVKIVRPNTDDLSYQDYKVYLEYVKDYALEKIIYASVVPFYDKIIIDLAKALNIQIRKITPLDIEKKLINIDNREQVGGDFVANFLAMNARKKPNYICVSMGTSTTLLLAQDYVFSGAIIAPGIEISANSLLANAKLLDNFVWQNTDLAIGKNTDEALTIGIVNAHFYMIDGLIKKIKEKYNINDVVFTGGNCHKILKLLEDNNYPFIEDLIFQGMKLFC